MNGFWGNFLIEIGLFTVLGILYYFYQKRKIIHFEENKKPIVMGMILEACLADKSEKIQPELDAVITALDDFLHNRVDTPPILLLGHFMNSTACSPELKDVIKAGLHEIEDGHGKK